MTGGGTWATFGRNLTRQRQTRGWTQDQAARETGIGRATIARAETGHPITLHTAIRLAAAYDTTVDALLGTQEPPP